MVQISFLLVVHREQAYVRRCVDSVLAQTSAEIELIAIDDASPDHGPALLDELAEADPRLRVEHLAQRVGLGAARNLALDLARGEYVWFIDTTDTLAADAVVSVADRLRRHRPDVLVVDHDLVGPLGAVRPAVNGERLAGLAQSGPGSLLVRPAFAELATGVWDKILRREHVHDTAGTFGPSGHSELTVTWPAFIGAASIEASPAPSIVHHEPPNALHDARSTGTPFDVLAQHEAVWSAMRRRPRSIMIEPIVRAALLRQALSLLERVEGPERPVFFARASAAYRSRGGSPTRQTPRSLPQLRTHLVASDRFRAYDAVARSADRLKTARGRADRAARHVRGARERVRAAELERAYRGSLRRPVDPELAVFSAYWNRGYQCNPRAIYEAARMLVPSMRGVWVVTAEAAATLPAGIEHVVEGTHEYYDAVARAGVLVNNVNFPNDIVKRPGTSHVMTHHGTPLKRMGTDVTGRAGRRDLAPLLRRVARWDYSVSSNVFSTLIWERVYPGTYESLEVGYPRNDVLARAGDADVAAARAALGVAPHQRVVLHAPTHREYRPDWVPTLDVAAVADALGPDVVVLDRRHYFSGSEPRLDDLHRQGRVLDVSDHPAVEELCLAADVLISDYSSIIFDYAVLDRPIVIHAPDWDVYRTMRGTYFDLMAQAPGSVTRTVEDVVAAIAAGDDHEGVAAARQGFRERFCTLDDGHAAERVVRRVWLGER